jgi:flagellar biosynthesis protein FlhF
MQYKTFTAQTMERALAKVKKELGPEAIIVSSRNIENSPSGACVEVTAAADPGGGPREAPPAKPFPGDARYDQIQSGIEEIRGFLSLLISSKDYFIELQNKQPLAEIYHALLTRGFDEKLLYILLQKTVSDFNGSGADKHEILNAFCGHLLGQIKLARPFKSLAHPGGPPPVFTFLGPTGVGKTTTLAKLAAQLKLKRSLEVGIISLDTYRIGAVDQLQTYANILEVPFCVAQSKEELNKAKDRFSNFDLILVDTTGRNFLNKEHVLHLRSLFEGERCSHFLVLSATAKDEDLRKTIQHFREIPIQACMFTKLDETASHGCMINQLLRFQHPLSYLGTGQRVPEDIELASQKKLLSLLFSTTGLNG